MQTGLMSCHHKLVSPTQIVAVYTAQMQNENRIGRFGDKRSVYTKRDFFRFVVTRNFIRILTYAVDRNIFHRVRTNDVKKRCFFNESLWPCLLLFYTFNKKQFDKDVFLMTKMFIPKFSTCYDFFMGIHGTVSRYANI